MVDTDKKNGRGVALPGRAAVLIMSFPQGVNSGAEHLIQSLAGDQQAAAQAVTPLILSAEAMAGARVADSMVLIAFVLGLLGAGYLIKRSTETFNPWVFTSVVLGVCFLTAINLDPYQIEKVELTAESVTEVRYGGEAVVMPWSSVTSIEWDGGSLFPIFADDGALKLHGADGAVVSIPAWAGDRADAAAIARDNLPPEVSVKD